jgi:hypothetical protein
MVVAAVGLSYPAFGTLYCERNALRRSERPPQAPPGHPEGGRNLGGFSGVSVLVSLFSAVARTFRSLTR